MLNFRGWSQPQNYFNSEIFLNLWYVCLKSQKVFWTKTGACRDGTLKNQPNKMGTTPQHFHTIPTSCAILPTMLCVSCVHSRVVEGSGLGSAGCMFSACWCEWRVSCVLGGCNAIATEHGRYGLHVLNAEAVKCTSSAESVYMACWSVSYVVKFYYCWTWQIFCMQKAMEWAVVSALFDYLVVWIG